MKRRNRPAKRPQKGPPPAANDRIYGVHAAQAALANPKRKILALYATQNGLSRIEELIDIKPFTPILTSPADLSKRLGSDTVHQGLLVEAEPLNTPDLDEILPELTRGRPLIVLDQVTDPHNVGAILRSAATFNAAAVLMTRRNSPPLDGTLAKAASGAVEHVPVVLVANLARALETLGDAGLQRIGLDGAADMALEATEIQDTCALILGAEHKGLRRLTSENCDFLCRLTTTGPLRSLNVSNAAAVALHTLAMQPK